MKKEATKKSKWWIWLIVAVLALAVVAAGVVGLVVALLGGGNDSAVPQDGRAELYWNIDKKFYTQNSESGLSTREPGEDGVYRVRFAYNGEQVELPVADKQLINYIDTMDCMGIVKDSDGTVIDVVDAKTLATETARMFYVRKVSGDVITLNSSMAMNGMSMDIPVKDVTEVYDVDPNAELVGQLVEPTALKGMDAVTVYSNAQGDATHVYIVSHPVESPVYWRADSGTYNSTEKKTTRVPDEEGYYTIPFYVDGEYVELKCNVEGIVNTIDAKNRFKAHTGLVLDEEGHIVDNMLAATGIRGLLGCEMYDITELNGTSFTAEALLAGSGDIYNGNLAADAKIYNVSLQAKPDVRGKAIDSLQMGDRIVAFENADGQVVLVFVTQRLIDGPMYFNMTKKYSSTNKSTTRTPDGNGWYYIELFSEGVTKTYKTKDKAIMDYIDSQNNRGVHVELDGDVITYAYPGESVSGYGPFVGYTIQNVTGSILSIAPSTTPDSVSNRIMNAECKIYNMSGVKQAKGEITELQIGDYCILWRNPRSEIVYIYVIRRMVDAPVYFSVTRKWDSTKQSTTRQPDADGYYVYESIKLGTNGTVKLKTKSKTVADFLDSQSPQTFAIKANAEGVIYEYYETAAVYGGSRANLNHVVKRLSPLVTYYSETNKTYTPKLAENVKIYNMSTAFERFRGEPTTLQLNDNIQCYTNAKGEIAMIMVRQRKVTADIYFSKTRVKTVDENGNTTRQPDADGWYVFECAKDGKEVTVKTKDLAIATFMDAQSPQSFALKVDKDGVVEKAYATAAATGGSTRALNAVVKSVDGGKIIVRQTNGTDYEMPMASKYKVYNVSDNYDKNFGEVTKIKVGDTLQSYTDASNKVTHVFVKVRPAENKLAWVVEQKYDSTNKVSLRQPDANGLFSVELAIDGVIKEYKVQGQKVINYIDSANGAVACTFKGGIIVNSQSAIYGTGIWTSVDAAVIATVQALDETSITVKNSKGETLRLEKAKEYVCYDVSGKAEFIGKAATAKVGDYGRMYLNMDKQIMYFYIMPTSSTPSTPSTPVVKDYDNSNLQFADGTTDAKCPYCEKVVTWTALEAITADTTLEANKHYYLAEDLTISGTFSTAGNACIHLNGHNITSSKRVFHSANSGDILTIMGNGIVTGSYNDKSSASVAGATITSRGGVNLIGGTYKHTNSQLPTILMARAQKEMNIYKDVVIEGTEGVTGSNLYVAFGIVNIHGATITGGTAVTGDTSNGRGGNIYIAGANHAGTAAAARVVITDAKIDGGIYLEKRDPNSASATYELSLKISGETVISEKDGGLTLTQGAIFNLGELEGEGKIYVTGNGTITSATGNAAAYVNTKVLPASANVTLEAQGDVIVATMANVEPEPVPTWKMAWVVDPKFDSANSVTTRTSDAEGYYHIDLSIDGVTKTYKTKATGIDGTGNGIDYADQSGASGRPISVCLTDVDSVEFTSAYSAVYGGHVGAKAAKTGKITAVNGSTVTVVSTDIAVAADAKIYNVSDKAVVEGEVTTIMVDDTIRAYTNADGELLYVYITARTAEVEVEPVPTWYMAWNVDPQYDETNSVTTRTPNADGYYFIDLAINGEIKTYKTKATGDGTRTFDINYFDNQGFKNRACTVYLNDVDGDEILEIRSGANSEVGTKGAKVVTLTGVNGNTVTANGYEGTLLENAKIFDVSDQATVEGELTTLRVGDYVRFYTADANATATQIVYGYIYTRVVVEELDLNTVCQKADAMASVFATDTGAGVQAECPVCQETVLWTAMPAISGGTSLTSGHYYFASDVNVASGYYSFNGTNEAIEACIHFNGKTFENTGTGNTRSFYVENATVNFMGSGNIIGARGVTTAAERCGSTLEVVGKYAAVNLCGGTWSKTRDTLDVIGVRAFENGAFNMYDGTVINIGNVQGNALWLAGGKISLSGGEINGDVMIRTYKNTSTITYTADVIFDGVTVNGQVKYSADHGTGVTSTVQGDTVIAELVPMAQFPVYVGRLTAGADIKVTAEGAFTVANPNAQNYVDDGFISAKAEGKTLTVSAEGVISCVDAPKAYDNSNLVFEEGTTKAMCPYCGEVKEWVALQSTADNSTDGLKPENGTHYYLAEDLLENKGRYNVSGNICVHLNGHNVTNVSNRVFTLATSSQETWSLTIMGNGIVTGSYASTATANVAGATISARANLNLIGGTYRNADNTTLPTVIMTSASRTMTIYEDVTIEGTVDLAFGDLVMYGGNVNAIRSLGQDVGGTAARASATIRGGVVENAYLALRDPNSASATYQLDLIVAGNAKIKNIELVEGAKLTLGNLTKGAEIGITAVDGAVTFANNRAADYLNYGYIKAAVDGKTITEKDGILSIG